MRFWSRPSSRAAHKNIQRTVTIVIAETRERMIPPATIPDILPVGHARGNPLFGTVFRERSAGGAASARPWSGVFTAANL